MSANLSSINPLGTFGENVDGEPVDIQSIRGILASRGIMIGAVYGFAVILLSIARAMEHGWAPIYFLYLGAFLVVIAAALYRRHLSNGLLAVVFLAIPALTGAAGLSAYGLAGLGIVPLIVFGILAAVFYGIRGGIIATILGLVVLITIGIAVITGAITFSFDIATFVTSLSSWAFTIGMFALWTGLSVVVVGGVNGFLTDSMQNLSTRTAELETINRHLQEEIDRRKKTENDLLHSEARYRAVAEDTPIMICRFLPGGEITYVNKAFGDFFHKKPEELVGLNFLTFIAEEDRAGASANMSTLNIGSPVRTHVYRITAPNGEMRRQRWTSRALFDSTGNAAAYQSVGEDITERTLAEQALAESEEKYRNIAETSLDGILQVNINGEITFANKAVLQMSGLTMDQVLGRKYFESVSEADLPAAQENFQTLLSGKGVQTELTLRRKDGTSYPILLNAVPLVVGGRVVGLTGMYQDITQRKQMELSLVKSQMFLDAVIEQSPYAMWISDEKGTLVRLNQACRDLLQITD